jgi:hypothetical protein
LKHKIAQTGKTQDEQDFMIRRSVIADTGSHPRAGRWSTVPLFTSNHLFATPKTVQEKTHCVATVGFKVSKLKLAKPASD